MSRLWGGSPTHNLSPALFSHLLFTAQCLDYASCPQSSPISPLSGEKISFLSRPSRASVCCLMQARLGLLFLFLLFFCPSAVRLLPMGRLLVFPHFGLPGFPSREKPGAFTQEKTDASYPRVSLDSCLWHLQFHVVCARLCLSSIIFDVLLLLSLTVARPQACSTTKGVFCLYHRH